MSLGLDELCYRKRFTASA